jgi:hypothetical protein
MEILTCRLRTVVNVSRLHDIIDNNSSGIHMVIINTY